MESIIYVGMDVHKDTYSLCSFNAERNLLFSQTQMKSTTGNVVRYLKKVSAMNNGALTLCGYEAGPTGFGCAGSCKNSDLPASSLLLLQLQRLQKIKQ